MRICMATIDMHMLQLNNISYTQKPELNYALDLGWSELQSRPLMKDRQIPPPHGFRHLPLYFSPKEQAALIDCVKTAVKTAPFYQPTMPQTGAPLSVVMTNFGTLGWVTDKTQGYRYQTTHPKTGTPWPPLPDLLVKLWKEAADWPDLPEACLVNWYREGSKMGPHIDSDELAVNAPVISISLGDPAMFRIGGPKRSGPTHRIKLMSGDVVIMGGASRQCYHSVSKIYYGQSALVPKGGRINLTMRRVKP